MSDGWIGFDLDGTLAKTFEATPGERPLGKVGEPIPTMIARVKWWLAKGYPVRIVTARVAPPLDHQSSAEQHATISTWCKENIGEHLPITDHKDLDMLVLYDDRVVQVEQDTGRLLGPEPEWKDDA